MSIIGCDLHSRYQVIALVETETGEMVTRRLEHENGEARAFYATLPKPSLIGMEATATRSGSSAWWPNWATSCGSGTRPRFGPAPCGGRRPTRETPSTCWICC